MASSISTVAYIYQRVYSDDAVGDAAMRDHKLLKALTKKGGMWGPSPAFYYAIRYGNPQGISGTFSSAQTAEALGPSKGVQMGATRSIKYGYITLDGPSMAAAAGSKGAFLDLVTQETDGVIEELGDAYAFDLYRDGNGIRGRGASESSDVVTLTVPDDARNFKVGMWLGSSANSDGSSPRTGNTEVTAVDIDAGTVTFDVSDITSFAATDYLFRLGDPGTCIDGLADHFPLTAPVLGVDSFRGVDRGAHPALLAGSRIDDTGAGILHNAGRLAVKISQNGKKATTLTLNPANFWTVAQQLNAKVTYEGGGPKALAGFEGFDLHTPAGTLRAISDADCPTNRGYVLNMDTLYIKHLESLFHIITDDGRPSLRLSTSDGIETRARSMSNLICTMPAANGVFSI